MKELILSVDTSSPAGSVAVSRGEDLLGEIFLNVRSTHSDRLLVVIRQLLGDLGLSVSDVDGLGVVLGPGSFTGLRVGVATVKGLALATGVPAMGVSSLRTLALQAPFASLPVCAMLDARKGEVYAGLFDCHKGGAYPLGPERVLSADDLLSTLDGETLFVGNGAVLYRTLIVRQLGNRAHFLTWNHNLPRASSAAVLALDDLRQGKVLSPEQLNPIYIRLSEAEITWSKRHQNGAIEG